MTVSTTIVDGIATVTLDDGKVNALTGRLINELKSAVDEAGSCRAVVVTGRPGLLTAGLDVDELRRLDIPGRADLFARFGRFLLDLWVTPCPVVCAADGHAVAAGTLIALASDHVVAADGEFRWGMTEGRIGLELSDFSILLVRSRLAPLHADRLLLQGMVVDPRTAVEVGYAHEAVPPADVLERAQEVARTLSRLPAQAYARNKLRLRGDAARRARDHVDEDIASLLATQVTEPPAAART
jgi:enoyl-CoA hydratase